MGLLFAMHTPAPTGVPEVPVVAPAAAARFSGPGNRFFADEVAGADAQYTDPASITGPLPERLNDLSRPAPRAAAERYAPFGTNNRMFADEILGGSGVPHWTALDAPALLPQHGPR
jgi:hypothetical protein